MKFSVLFAARRAGGKRRHRPRPTRLSTTEAPRTRRYRLHRRYQQCLYCSSGSIHPQPRRRYDRCGQLVGRLRRFDRTVPGQRIRLQFRGRFLHQFRRDSRHSRRTVRRGRRRSDADRRQRWRAPDRVQLYVYDIGRINADARGTTYWLVLSDSTTSAFPWGRESSRSGDHLEFENDGTGWISETRDLAFNLVQETPEPGGSVLAAGGLAMLALVRSLRLRRRT